jgi:broad specificity phosphatase PhoE
VLVGMGTGEGRARLLGDARTVGGMELVLVRHGDAIAGFDGVIAGERGCRGLTDLGRRQAEALRDHLATSPTARADVLLVSTIPRAIETAEIIAPGLGLEISGRECDLCEVHTGEADGLEWSAYSSTYESFDMEAEPDRVFAPGGDSWNSFHERVGSLLERLAGTYPDQRVVAVCHAGVIMASMRVLLGVPHPNNGTQMRPTNTGLTEWGYAHENDQWTLHTFNDSGHLLGLKDPSHG